MNITDLYDLFLTSNGVTTDTRNIIKGGLFFALKGGNFNGNEFAYQAIEAGAKAAIIDDPKYRSCDTILVDDVLKALQDLANHHRKQFDIPFIGITGSNGKTTTKELIYSVLSQSFKTHATAGNFNNHIGVPLTLLAMPKDTEMAIIEMGANGLNEIGFLSNIAEPTHGIITNIGKAHLEGFGSYEGVLKTKKELYDFIRKEEGTIFRNAQLDYLTDIGAGIQSFTFGNSGNEDMTGELIESFPFLKIQSSTLDCTINSQVLGVYNFDNILAAMSIGHFFGMTADKIKAGVESYVPSANRSQLMDYNGGKVILDAYNANPTSMQAAVSNFLALPYENKHMILGDMFELGDDSAEEHEALIQLVIDNQIQEKTVFVGKLFKDAIVQLKLEGVIKSFEDSSSLKPWFQSQEHKDSCFLIKGSRGIALEEILE